jgi:hypothetical protein
MCAATGVGWLRLESHSRVAWNLVWGERMAGWPGDPPYARTCDSLQAVTMVSSVDSNQSIAPRAMCG